MDNNMVWCFFVFLKEKQKMNQTFNNALVSNVFVDMKTECDLCL